MAEVEDIMTGVAGMAGIDAMTWIKRKSLSTNYLKTN